MNRNDPQQTDWLDWLRRWDVQQDGYVPEREARFAAMFDALAALLPGTFVALDLGCGPGSLSRRLLARFPEAQAIAVDLDPVLLAIGQRALGTVDGVCAGSRPTWRRPNGTRPWAEGGSTPCSARPPCTGSSPKR